MSAGVAQLYTKLRPAATIHGLSENSILKRQVGLQGTYIRESGFLVFSFSNHRWTG